MKYAYAYLGIGVLLILGAVVMLGQGAETPAEDMQNGASDTNTQQFMADRTSDLTLTSPAFEHNGKIPSKYTCDGDDVNPALSISGVPEAAQSLVLIMDDPDALKLAGKVWDHWIVFNIPPTTNTIQEGEEPDGVHGAGTAGNIDYRGPCPPDAEHGYIFKLYALDTELALAEGATKAEVEAAMDGHILAETQLVGRYERQ